MYADIHQWYLAVNDAIPTTEKYEDMILKFYQKLYILSKQKYNCCLLCGVSPAWLRL